MNIEYRTKWTVENGIAVIRQLQNTAHLCGYHLALAGGILNRGYSAKDLDIMVLPMGSLGQKWETFKIEIEQTLNITVDNLSDSYPDETAAGRAVYVAMNHPNGRIDFLRY